MYRIHKIRTDCFSIVNRFPQYIKYSSKCLSSHRNLYRFSCIHYFQTSSKSICSCHCNCPDNIISIMRVYFGNQLFTVIIIHFQGIIYIRQFLFKSNIYDRSNYLNQFSLVKQLFNLLCLLHYFFLPYIPSVFIHHSNFISALPNRLLFQIIPA